MSSAAPDLLDVSGFGCHRMQTRPTERQREIYRELGQVGTASPHGPLTHFFVPRQSRQPNFASVAADFAASILPRSPHVSVFAFRYQIRHLYLRNARHRTPDHKLARDDTRPPARDRSRERCKSETGGLATALIVSYTDYMTLHCHMFTSPLSHLVYSVVLFDVYFSSYIQYCCFFMLYFQGGDSSSFWATFFSKFIYIVLVFF